MTLYQAPVAPFKKISRYKLEKEDRIIRDGVLLTWMETNTLAHILRPGETGENCEIFHEVFEEELHLEKIRVDRGYFSLESIRRRAMGVDNIGDLPPEEMAIVLHRLRWVETFNDLYKKKLVKKSPKRLAEAVPVIAALLENTDKCEPTEGRRAARGAKPRAGFENPSPTQLGNWVRKFKNSKNDPIVLHPRYARSGNRTPRLDPVVQKLLYLSALRYCRPTKPSVQILYDNLSRVLRYTNNRRSKAYRIPSKRTLERAIADLDDYDKEAGRNGRDWARRNYMPSFEGPEAYIPMQRVEMDEWRVHLSTLCIEAGIWTLLSEKERAEVERTRCWLTVAIDCATRCILSMFLTTRDPSTRSAIEGLRWIMTDKDNLRIVAGAQTNWPSHGIPRNLFTDKGAGFKSNDFIAVAHHVGIGEVKANAGLSQFRGKIERFFRSLDQRLVSRFEGRTFSNSKEKGDYDTKRTASITCDELNKALVRYVCDVYHNTEHAGLGGRTPAQEWNRLVATLGKQILPRKHEMRELFGVPESRTVGKKGIRLFGHYYQSPALTEIWHRKLSSKVDIRIDDRDVTQISFRDLDGSWATAEVVGRIQQVVSIEYLEHNFAALTRKGLPAFDVDDSVEIMKRMDEALKDLNVLARHSAERAGLFNEQVLEERIARVRSESMKAASAWITRSHAAGADSHAKTIAKPRKKKAKSPSPAEQSPADEVEVAEESDGSATKTSKPIDMSGSGKNFWRE